MPSLRTLVLLLSVNVVFGTYEEVVVKILDKLSQEQKATDSKSITYTVPLRSNTDPKLTVSLNSGKIILTNISLDKGVDYYSSDSKASFNFTANVEVFVAYRYSLSAFGSRMSTGTASSKIPASMDLEIELSQENCKLRLVEMMNFKMKLIAEILPADNFLFPSTVDLAPDHPVEKSVRNEIIESLRSNFDERSFCDCVDCF